MNYYNNNQVSLNAYYKKFQKVDKIKLKYLIDFPTNTLY